MPASLSVVMPFHNEGPTLRRAVRRLLKQELPVDLEAVLVDDGSTDGGIDTISDLLTDQRVVVVRRAERGGKGRAVRAGIEAATGDLIGVLDADLEYDPADLAPLARAIVEEGATVAYGTRDLCPRTAHSPVNFVGNRLTTMWASVLFKTRLRDIHTCLKVAPRQVWRSLGLTSDGFELDSEATARFLKAGYRIREVPASYTPRSIPQGKKLRWTDGLRVVTALLRVRFSASRAPGGRPSDLPAFRTET